MRWTLRTACGAQNVGCGARVPAGKGPEADRTGGCCDPGGTGSHADGRAGPAADRRPSDAVRAPAIRTRTPADLDRATVRAVQQALDKQGFKVGAADGVWGAQTESAIGNFQRARGMTASGELDAHTLAALGLLPAGADRPMPRGPASPSEPPISIRLPSGSSSRRSIRPASTWVRRTGSGATARYGRYANSSGRRVSNRAASRMSTPWQRWDCSPTARPGRAAGPESAPSDLAEVPAGWRKRWC